MTQTLHLSNLQLLQSIETILSAPSAQAMDTDQLEACLTELQTRAPVMETYDADAAWDALQAQLETETAKTDPVSGKPSKKAARSVRVLIAVAAVLAAVMVTYAALGGKSFFRLIRWEDGRLVFQSFLSDEVVRRYHQATEFDTLEEALSEGSAPIGLIPSVLPQGYVLSGVTRTQDLGITTYALRYANGEAEMELVIYANKHTPSIHLVPSTAYSYVHSNNQIDFTVYSLDDRWHALWAEGMVTYSLSAPITEAELLILLDSIS